MTRRDWLKASAIAGGGLVLAAHLPAWAAPRGGAEPAALNAWLRIAGDGEVTIVVSQAEMGQGIATTLPAVLAEELGADWPRVKLVTSPAHPDYRNPRLNWQFTGNSESMSSFFELMRKMGASAREMLIAAAAARWQVAAAGCRAEKGRIVHAPTGRSVGFGAVAAAAAALPPPQDPPLKPRSAWTLLGRSLPRVDNPAKIDGSATFGVDVVVPGMVHAAVRASPAFGGKVKRFDATSVAKRPGVIAVVPIPDGIAVVAETYWQAKTALDALDVEFEDGPQAQLGSDGLMRMYRDAMDAGAGWVPVRPGAAGAPRPLALEAEYESQFLAHATMEPMNCTASVTADGCDVWAPTQGQELAQIVVGKVLGLPAEKIRIHRTFLGGGFGRRLIADFVVHAVVLAKAVGRPVKVLWTREEDMGHDFYRPAVLHRLRATRDDRGEIAEIAHRLVSPSILQYVSPPSVTDTMDPSCLEGLAETPYAVPSWKVDFKLLKIPVPTSVLRTTGYGPNIFAVESFVDELAAAQKEDPLRYRRKLLRDDPRAQKLIGALAERSGWERPPAAGRGRGVAFSVAFGTYIGHVVELSVSADKVIRIQRIVAAVDPGLVLDPDITASSIEGGTAWGLSCALLSQITFDRGRAVQTNFHDYRVLRLPQMPPVEVHIVDGGAISIGGVGEVGPVTVIPALTNAIFAATGARIRSLPLARHGYRLAT
ncbi:MAG TPA: molybdopterin cofactor-binding domain-containing protein [Haliangiales bacterium]|nr:molybdopterin cofactor-binding domain-containing protein [Haliangiales bacterium]